MGNKKCTNSMINSMLCINSMIVCLFSVLGTRAKVVQSWSTANPGLKLNPLFYEPKLLLMITRFLKKIFPS